MLLLSGIASAFPVFLPPLLEEFGGSRGATASTASLLWVGGAVLGPLAPSLTVFILAVGVGGGIGVGLTGMITQAALIADAYVRRRGLAMGIAFSGSMAAYALALPAQWAINR